MNALDTSWSPPMPVTAEPVVLDVSGPGAVLHVLGSLAGARIHCCEWVLGAGWRARTGEARFVISPVTGEPLLVLDGEHEFRLVSLQRIQVLAPSPEESE